MKLSTLYTSVPDYIEVADVPANPSSAAQLLPANIITTLNLNAEVQDTAGIATLGSNRVTIPAGTYYYEAIVCVGRTATAARAACVLGLWNHTASSWISRSSASEYEQYAIESEICRISGQFVVTVQTQLELRVLVRTECRARLGGEVDAHTDTTSGAMQRQTLKLWKLK